jgi:phage pi2 protein 07
MKKIISDSVRTKIDIANGAISFKPTKVGDKWEIAMRFRETGIVIAFLDGLYDTEDLAWNATISVRSVLSCLQYV